MSEPASKCFCKKLDPKYKCPCETRDFKLLEPIPDVRTLIVKNNTYANFKEFKKKSAELNTYYNISNRKSHKPPATAAANSRSRNMELPNPSNEEALNTENSVHYD
jgi:hypothetical protein